MEAAGIATASELARESGVSEPVASRWLRGLTQPDVANLRRVAPVLGVPILELLVAAGHLTPAEAKLRAAVKPPAPVRRGVSTEGLDEDKERQVEAFVEFLRSQNPRKRT